MISLKADIAAWLEKRDHKTILDSDESVLRNYLFCWAQLASGL